MDTDSQTEYLGPVTCEGKTKMICAMDRLPGVALIISKDDITAGDGAKRDQIEGKAVWATTTTCNVFRLLNSCNVPVAFLEQHNALSFFALLCDMLPYEVVVRREAHGSYLKRHPGFNKGARFGEPLVEFFLKTTDRKWGVHKLPCDDPFMRFSDVDESVLLYHPSEPYIHDTPFLVLPHSEVFRGKHGLEVFKSMAIIAVEAFTLLEAAWELQGGNLVDYKVEFGFDTEGRLLIADVIDNDSWRVLLEGVHIDKQLYRDGSELDEVAAKYRLVAELTGNFP
jgi:phosphoribosylaminoimidazole carboxylase / phosphoribosylaminoimidazole-succinocarboxamide synthase